MSFSDIKGHDNIKLFFKRALSSGRVASSYLFYGPPGVGKALMAITFAKALNCQRQDGDGCDECPSCTKIENGSHPDVMVLEAPKEKDAISIGQIRELERRINLTPYEGHTKVFIIKDSHLMHEAAANCLLKTLEEPPRNSVIMLITPKAEELLPTVRSRCRQVRFGPLELRSRLELAQKKGFSGKEALFLSRLENADSGALLSILAKERLPAYINRMLAEFGSAKALLDEKNFIFGESKAGMKFAILVLAAWFRDIFILKTGAPPALLLNPDRADELKRASDEFSFEELGGLLKEVEEAYFCIDRNVAPKLALNNLKLKLKRR